MKFSFTQWNVNTDYNFISYLAEQGVKAVEHGPSFLIDYNENAIAENAKLFENADIELYSTHAPFGNYDDLSSLNNSIRLKAVALFKELILRANIAGIKCLIVHPGSVLNNDNEETRTASLLSSIEAILPIAEKYKIKLAIENMPPGHLGENAKTILKIINTFQSDCLGICFDTGHANLDNNDVCSVFNQIHDKIIAFHLHDNDSERDLHLQPPYGTIDWNSLITEISKYHFDFPALIEAQPWNNSSPSQLLNEVDALFSGKIITTNITGKTVNVVCNKCKHYLFENLSCACFQSTNFVD